MNGAYNIESRPLAGSGWRIAWGVLLIIVGILAVLMPAIAALATAIVLGWLLIFGGAFELAHAIHTRSRNGFSWKLVCGLLTLVLGIAILLLPLPAVATLALWVGCFLAIGGIARAILAFYIKPGRGWGWVLFSGLLSIAVAILILVGWPHTSVAIIGLWTGLSLIAAGIWRIMLARRIAF